jgi:hypothetical protein
MLTPFSRCLGPTAILTERSVKDKMQPGAARISFPTPEPPDGKSQGALRCLAVKLARWQRRAGHRDAPIEIVAQRVHDHAVLGCRVAPGAQHLAG